MDSLPSLNRANLRDIYDILFRTSSNVSPQAKDAADESSILLTFTVKDQRKSELKSDTKKLNIYWRKQVLKY